MSGQSIEVVTKASPHSVEDTIASLTAIVADRGLTLFAVIDHSGAAAEVPLKVLVWTNGEQTNVSYTSTDELASRYGLTDDLADRLRAIDGITDAVINR